MRTVKYTSRFKRDYKREKAGRHGKTLDAVLMAVVDLLAADAALPHRNFDHPLSGAWSDFRDCHLQARPDPHLPKAGCRQFGTGSRRLA